MIPPTTSQDHHLGLQRLIINADDLGFSQQVNQSIEKALVHGWISSATLMANGPCCNEGAALAHRHQARAGFGIHLNLTEFQPLSDPSALATHGLLNEEGAFSGSIRQLKGDRDLMAACFRELDAQIRQARSLGVEISHFDSHHHVHTIPWMLPVIRRLQQQHGIWRMRATMNVYGRRLHSTPPLTRILAKKAWSATCRLRGSRMPQVFTGLDVFLEDSRRKPFQRSSSIELMCHPGQHGYEEDLALLERCQTIIEGGPYRLCSFKDI
ncbi:ChbG/HpnK family deacetylase [Cyanobium sp. FGCU-6]|nr:ChbG/HpnK family deacetylase [Cyanobium sp. FGCU6]